MLKFKCTHDTSNNTTLGNPSNKNLSKIRLRASQNSESRKMEALIAIVNKLQDVLLMTGKDSFEFPQIVVVGDQSSGKSSVLESIVGKSFLPRGVGTVTRRPLLLHLESLAKKKSRGDEESYLDHVVFKHCTKIYTDFKEVMKEIEEETDRVAGPNKGICSEPIIMTMYSKHAASNLTLVDLPGIIKVPMGDQPHDIENTIKSLIMKYISNPNSIILAVVTANTDIATSESLKIAKEADPDGSRTLAVVTKLDIMDAGTDATDILNGNVIQAKLGVVGVVNRSQRDISVGKSLKEAAVEELNFFYKNYPLIAHKHGTTYLAKCLQTLLVSHIRKCLPQLRIKIQSALAHQSNLLTILNGPNLNSASESLLHLITKFSSSYCAKIQGTCNELETQELGGGARISFIFHEIFGNALNNINPLEGYSRKTLMTAVRNSTGPKPCIFVPETCFEQLVKKQVMRLEVPALRCVQVVFEEMEKILYTCSSLSNFNRYPKLSQRVVDVSVRLLKSRILETESLVRNLISIHAAYVNTAHPDFKNLQTDEKSNDNQIVGYTDDENPTVIFIEKLLSSYFHVIKKIVQDTVPKAIMFSFVNYVIDNILPELVNQLFGPGKAEELLEESISIREQKNHVMRMVNALEKANNIITDIKEGQFML